MGHGEIVRGASGGRASDLVSNRFFCALGQMVIANKRRTCYLLPDAGPFMSLSFTRSHSIQ